MWATVWNIDSICAQSSQRSTRDRMFFLMLKASSYGIFTSQMWLSQFHFLCIIRMAIVKSCAVLILRTEQKELPASCLWICFIPLWGQRFVHWPERSHPVLSRLLPVCPPQGTDRMKFMVSDRGTFNIANDLGMRNANTPMYTQTGYWRDFLRDSSMWVSCHDGTSIGL